MSHSLLIFNIYTLIIGRLADIQQDNKAATSQQPSDKLPYVSKRMRVKNWRKYDKSSLELKCEGRKAISRKKICLALALVCDFCCGENIFQQRNIFLQQQRERGKRAHSAELLLYLSLASNRQKCVILFIDSGVKQSRRQAKADFLWFPRERPGGAKSANENL